MVSQDIVYFNILYRYDLDNTAIYWISLYEVEQDIWLWNDNSALTYNNFASGEPISGPCVYLGPNAEWYTSACGGGNKEYYICEKSGNFLVNQWITQCVTSLSNSTIIKI